MTYGNRKCKGSCTQPAWEFNKYKATDRRSPYLRGYKRCSECDIYYDKGAGSDCPCCGLTLKAKPRGMRSRRRFNEQVLGVVGY